MPIVTVLLSGARVHDVRAEVCGNGGRTQAARHHGAAG